MLRDDIEQYTKLTGKDGWSVPIIKIGAYLDGYNKGLKVLEKIKTEMQDIMIVSQDEERIYQEIKAIIDKHIAESGAQDDGV